MPGKPSTLDLISETGVVDSVVAFDGVVRLLPAEGSAEQKFCEVARGVVGATDNTTVPQFLSDPSMQRQELGRAGDPPLLVFSAE